MTKETIKKKIAKAKTAINEAKQRVKRAEMELGFIQDSCPHEHKASWTNNDGDGQFIVERCEDCGLQKDGGL